ncbi:hypothetical protein HHK36_014248 [Tetracentron sinense]|uniref:Cytochrome b5 heme-binding domain-containing protein n=1 Tax=Tetracentron sinense TaxID=13715 RepID=A0A834Z7R6_TETSI|nr:hypothetical protein HHK36_014248 [Tetracentron sinense]
MARFNNYICVIEVRARTYAPIDHYGFDSNSRALHPAVFLSGHPKSVVELKSLCITRGLIVGSLSKTRSNHVFKFDSSFEIVYDVTSYVEEHPGGDSILVNAGNDSTEGFYGPQHATRVFDMIDDFYIGDLEH